MWSLSQDQVHRSHLINNGGVWASIWGGVAFTDPEAEQWGWKAQIPPYSIRPSHIHGWPVLLTGLISFLPQSALLSCLRLEPAAAESCICPAWGLNLLLFPSSFICSFLVPPVCLIWHCKKAFLHLLIPSLVYIKKKSQVTFFHLVHVLESTPAAVESGTWIPKPISICFKRTDLTAKCQKGTWVLCTHLKGKLTNRNGDVSSTNDTKAKGRSKISLSRDLKHLFCGGQQMLSCHFLEVQLVIKLCPVIRLPSLYEARKHLKCGWPKLRCVVIVKTHQIFFKTY